MANNCMTRLAVYREKPITDKEAEAIGAFIKENIEYTGGEITYNDETRIEWEGDTRWAIPRDEITKLAKTFTMNVRAVGDEPGIGFVQVICAKPNGDIVQDEEIAFAL